MVQKNKDRKSPVVGVLKSRVTSHNSRNYRFLTFTLISLIFIFSAADIPAEDSRPQTYIRMEETEIIGVIEHPEITYIIPKTRIRFTKIPLQRDFSAKATRLNDPLALEREVRVKTLLTGP